MHHRAFSCLSLLFLAGIAPHLQANDTEGLTWNQWRGPQRNGQWPGEFPQSLSELELAWEKTAPALVQRASERWGTGIHH